MNPLVRIKGDDVFTNSLIIARETENRHINVKELINNYKTDFKELGTLSVLNRESSGGRPEQYYELNEPQASFLLTLMRNSKKVVAFKLALVKEFYHMRQLLLKRSTAEWQDARQHSKTIRLEETEEIKRYVEYCTKKGSENAKRYYSTISRLVNKSVGLLTRQRDFASCETLLLLSLLENIIRRTIAEELQKETEYHEIYYICKKKISGIMSYAYLPEQSLLTG